jgi:hypothetical protein
LNAQRISQPEAGVNDPKPESSATIFPWEKLRADRLLVLRALESG